MNPRCWTARIFVFCFCFLKARKRESLVAVLCSLSSQPKITWKMKAVWWIEFKCSFYRYHLAFSRHLYQPCIYWLVLWMIQGVLWLSGPSLGWKSWFLGLAEPKQFIIGTVQKTMKHQLTRTSTERRGLSSHVLSMGLLTPFLSTHSICGHITKGLWLIFLANSSFRRGYWS